MCRWEGRIGHVMLALPAAVLIRTERTLPCVAYYTHRSASAISNYHAAALEFERRKQKVAAILLHPGTVDTDLSQPFQKASDVGALRGSA